MTNLYATLGDGGIYKPARIFLGQRPTANGERIISAQSAAMVTDILTQLRRPDMPRAWALTRDVPSVAWKTGTSYGHRDAWSVGYSDRYAIGVWAGNFDGHGQKGLSGSEFAAPLLFDLFRAVEGSAALKAAAAPPHSETIEVCALSHQLPTEHCRERVRVAYIAGRTRLRACAMHRPIFVDEKTGERLAGACVAAHPHRQVVATVYPPELVAYWRAQNEPFEPLPPLAPSCADIASDAKPRIVSPDPSTPYRLRRGAPLEFQEILLSAQTSDAATLFWFEDGLLVASGDAAHRMFLRPRRGLHQLVVVDDAGRSDAVTYRVE